MSPSQDIRQSILRADAALVARHPWLGRDDDLALAFFVGAWAIALAAGAVWLMGGLSAWVVVPVIALCFSVLHELEHDLIHDTYLSSWPRLRTLILAGIWLGKASLDPWSRGRIHRWHHVASGQPDDIEERLIGLGLPWGPKRLLLTLLPLASGLVVPDIRRAARARRQAGGRTADLRHPTWFHLIRAVDGLLTLLPLIALAGLAMGAAFAWPLLVLWVLPNTLRHASIVLISSSSHYTDIPRGDLMVQNQVLDHPVFWPLQLFCWNFGATHILHHFVVTQPFWRRTLIWPSVKADLIAAGIRHNDLGSFVRANRWADAA